jgi:hypothetical protein
LGIILFIVAALYLRDPAPVDTPAGQTFGAFMAGVFQALLKIARIPHVWVAAAFGALCFGAMLALGVVWAPKLLMVRGLDAGTANTGASFLWVGRAHRWFITPWSSDLLRQRKLPAIVGIALQLVAVTYLLYGPLYGASFDMALCFLFGVGSSAHMLAFSTAADVVEPENIGTSAAIVNGTMFIVSGIMISRPGVRIGLGISEGIAPKTLGLAEFAALPMLVGVFIALVVAVLMRETYPAKDMQ